MRPRNPPPQLVLIRAAEARAAGNCWEAVAKKARRAAETVRRWPHRYPDEWAQALRAAERRVVDESADEAVSVLRELLRFEDAEVRHQAAWRLIYQRLVQSKLDLDLARLDVRTDAGGEDTFDRLTRGKTDEQLSHRAHSLRVYNARKRSRRA